MSEVAISLNLKMCYLLLLIVMIVSCCVGVIMVAEGTVEYTDNKQAPMEGTDGKPSEPNDGSSELVITVVGALLIVMGILLIGNSVLNYLVLQLTYYGPSLPLKRSYPHYVLGGTQK